MFESRKGLGILALLAGGVLAGVSLAEIGLRLAGVEYPSFQQVDPRLGASLRPGAHGWYRQEGESHVRINRDGLRDRDHEERAAPGTLRLAILGDSYAEALQVDVAKTFWRVLARELQGCKQPGVSSIEPINFGASGYGTAQELIMMRDRVWRYAPQVVLLTFLPANDIRNNSRRLESDLLKPYFVLRDGELVLDDSFLQAPGFRARQSLLWRAGYRLIDRSRLLQLVNEAKNSLQRRREVKIHSETAQRTPALAALSEAGLDPPIFLTSPGDDWEEAWRVTEALIVKMRDEVRARGADLWLVTATAGIQVHPDPRARERFARELGAPDLLQAERRILALGVREGIPIITLAQPFQRYAEEKQVYLHGFANTAPGTGHWNEQGHRLAGEIIAREACARAELFFASSRARSTTAPASSAP